MGPEEAARVLAKTVELASNRKKIDFGELCFPEQRAFVEDDAPFVAGCCGRRGGKSDAAVLKMLRSANENPNSTVLYITNSRPQAKRIAWRKLMMWDRRLDLGMKFNHADLVVHLPSCGSSIVLGGANDEAEIERYRGGDHPLVVIDEAQSIRGFLPYLIKDILLPTLADHDGQLVLIGTPNASCLGYFSDAANPASQTPLLGDTGEPMYSVHAWTGFRNPNISKAYRLGDHSDYDLALAEVHAVISRLCSVAGIGPGDVVYEREWRGQWIRDEEGLVYQVKPRNILDRLPEATDWRYVLGMDVGFIDATAYVVMAYSPKTGKCCVVESFQEARLLQGQQVAYVDRLAGQYDFESIVVDPGGGGKQLVEELHTRHGLPAQVAEKQAKVAAIGTLNSDLAAGSCSIVRFGNEDLLHDLAQLKWNYAKLQRAHGSDWKKRPKALSHLSIDDRTPDHLADAFLYAHRQCSHYLTDFEEAAPRPGTDAWILKQEQEIYEKVLKRAEAREAGKDQPWWAGGPKLRDF